MVECILPMNEVNYLLIELSSPRNLDRTVFMPYTSISPQVANRMHLTTLNPTSTCIPKVQLKMISRNKLDFQAQGPHVYLWCIFGRGILEKKKYSCPLKCIMPETWDMFSSIQPIFAITVLKVITQPPWGYRRSV